MLDPAKYNALSDYATRLKSLHERFTPHRMQIPPAKSVFNDGCKRVFLRWGRQTGKSQLISYIAVRAALLYPGSAIFILAPTSLQNRAIYLHSGLIESLIPPEYLAVNGVNKTDARFTLSNGSYIRLFGVENAQALRGLTADYVLADEIKDIPRDVIDSVVMPMLLVRGGTLLLSGTPPGTLNGPGAAYWALVELAENSPDWKAFRATSRDNPYTPPGAVDAERKLHEDRGTLDVFLREYEAVYSPDSHNTVFPMFSKEKHVRPYAELKQEILKNLGAWRFYVSMDPGSRFAVSLSAINEYTKKVIVFDEVFERGQESTSIGQIVPRILARLNQFAPAHFLDDPPVWVCDEAALWARNEIRDQFDINVWPSRKAQNQKMDGLSLMKDLFNSGKLILSDRCTGLIEQIQGYTLGPSGLPLKHEDDSIDEIRYLLGVANYSTHVENEPSPQAELPPGLRDDPKRGHTPEQDFGDPFDFGDESHLSLDLAD